VLEKPQVNAQIHSGKENHEGRKAVRKGFTSTVKIVSSGSISKVGGAKLKRRAFDSPPLTSLYPHFKENTRYNVLTPP
jgi:hypothetical protein